MNAYAETISSLLSQTHIDAINIPEVHDEVGRGERLSQIKSVESLESLDAFARYSWDRGNRKPCCVHMPLKKQMEWIQNIF